MKKTLLASLLAAAMSGGAVSLAQAQAWPNKPVHMLIPFPPGGPTDITGRTYADKLTAQLKQPFLVENRPGPNGIIVSNATIAAPADGYTLAFSSVGGQVLAPAINAYQKKPQDPDVLKLLVPVSQLAEAPLGVFVNPTIGINTLPQLIAQMRASPGKLNYGSDGIGSSTHLAEELFDNALNLKATHVPFKGTVDVMAAMQQNEVQWSFSGIGGPPITLHRQGRVKLIAVGGSSRLASLPDIPTVAETANLPGFDVASWFSIFMKSGTDKAVIAKLSEEIQKAGKLPDLIERLGAVTLQVKTTTPEQLQAKVDADFKKWSDLLRTGAIKFE